MGAEQMEFQSVISSERFVANQALVRSLLGVSLHVRVKVR